MNCRIAFLFGAAGIFCSDAFSQQAITQQLDAEPGIEVSVQVSDIDGKDIFSFNSSKPVVLASNTKLFTTAAALVELGEDFRWETKFYLHQQRLYVVGGGDPSLRLINGANCAEAMLDKLAEVLRQRQITSLREVVFDDRLFARPVRHPLWPEDQWQQSYCAPVSALAVEGNCLRLSFIGGQLESIPYLGAALKVKHKKAAPNTPLSAWWSSGELSIQVKGVSDASGEVVLAASDSRPLFQNWFVEGLRRRSIPCATSNWLTKDQQIPAPVLSQFEIYKHPSAWTLSEAIAVANKDSDNFVSEILMLTVASQRSEKASFSQASASLSASLNDAGMSGGMRNQVDGSGLARDWGNLVNTATTSQLCELLQFMAGHESGRAWFDSLPIAGVEGKLKSRFNIEIFQPGRVHAKTGWIRGASALSGYLLAGDEILTFSIVVNYTPDGKPRTNNARFKKFQEELLVQVLRTWK